MNGKEKKSPFYVLSKRDNAYFIYVISSEQDERSALPKRLCDPKLF